MKAVKLIIAMGICLCLMSVSFAGKDDEQNSRMQISPSDAFNAESAKVIYIGLVPHLQYSLTNKSANVVSGLTVILTGYDAKGNLAGRETWITRTAFPVGSKSSATLAMNLDMSFVKKMKVEFVPASATQGPPGCDPSIFCKDCSTHAKDLCGPRGVFSLTCTTGETCTCTFMCGHP